MSFSLEFKKQAVEELLRGESRPAQLCQLYNISSSILYHRKKQYSWGKFNNGLTTEEATLHDRLEKLEGLAGKTGSGESVPQKVVQLLGAGRYDSNNQCNRWQPKLSSRMILCTRVGFAGIYGSGYKGIYWESLL